MKDQFPEEAYELLGNIDIAEPTFGAQVGKGVLRTHPASACQDDPACCVHKPSDHPLRNAPMNWRGDRGLMERFCPHGIGHPDPDDLAHKKRQLGDRYKLYAFDAHGCDGCCS